jgi:hypothetical protein
MWVNDKTRSSRVEDPTLNVSDRIQRYVVAVAVAGWASA